jgi:flagellar motor switch protein FliN/FliY
MKATQESLIDRDRPADTHGSAAGAKPSVVASLVEYPDLEETAAGGKGSLSQLLDVAVHVTAELGRATLSIDDILKLGPGSVVGLDRGVAEPVDLLVQGVLFARGEVVVIDERFAIRIREIVDPKHGAKK